MIHYYYLINTLKKFCSQYSKLLYNLIQINAEISFGIRKHCMVSKKADIEKQERVQKSHEVNPRTAFGIVYLITLFLWELLIVLRAD